MEIQLSNSVRECRFDSCPIYPHRRYKNMKRIVNGKLYDTDTAELVCRSKIALFENRLYRTKKGRYFVYEKIGDIEDIKPLNEDKIFEWLSKHNPDKAMELFAERIEEA